MRKDDEKGKKYKNKKRKRGLIRVVSMGLVILRPSALVINGMIGVIGLGFPLFFRGNNNLLWFLFLQNWWCEAGEDDSGERWEITFIKVLF